MPAGHGATAGICTTAANRPGASAGLCAAAIKYATARRILSPAARPVRYATARRILSPATRSVRHATARRILSPATRSVRWGRRHSDARAVRERANNFAGHGKSRQIYAHSSPSHSARHARHVGIHCRMAGGHRTVLPHAALYLLQAVRLYALMACVATISKQFRGI